MNSHPPWTERRATKRIEPKGSLQLKLDGGVQHARIANISQSGAFAVPNEAADSSLVGRELEVDLRLDGPHTEWLALRARVLRADASGVALAFAQVSDAFLDLMTSCSRASNRRRRALRVVLIDETEERRRAIAEGFRAVGCDVVAVATPLAAVFELGESAFEPDLIAIADSVPLTRSDEVRRFVEENHPHARIIRVGEAGNAPQDVTDWLAAVPEDLRARIRELINEPR